ncbi:DMT family transporter [Labrys sp. LIt4]|uniref:DMT family transporter n=1 Tax=Labrys sp. LIt4 TaxID=2821355 RepID=UPI001AE0C9D3|nr:DMT family transporter [Labrys sp. LIt4]MBP0581060.1 DMT family transporter [Labrys sp. LIt4]
MWGVLAAVLSSGIGGTAVVATRSLSQTIDPITLGALRFGLGFVFLLPVACLRREAWPPRRDWPGVAGLGFLFFGLFPILFNAALYFTTAARGAIALSALPVLTMLAAAALGAEAMTSRKVLGVLVTMTGVALALLSGLSEAPAGAWRGDFLMLGAALVMALYTIWSRPFIARSGPVRFTLVAMGIGALCLVLVAAIGGGLANIRGLPPEAWLAAAYLGIAGSALVFFLWSFAVTHTTPTLVAIAVAVNPITASLAGEFFLAERLGWNFAAGLLLVCLGIVIAATKPGLRPEGSFSEKRRFRLRIRPRD